MASEKLGMVPPQQIRNPHPQLVFSEAFSCDPHPSHRRPAAGDPSSKTATRELTASFLDHHHYFTPPPPPPPQASHYRPQWNLSTRSPVRDESDYDEDDDNDGDDDDEDEEDDGEGGGNNDLGIIVAVPKSGDDNQKEGYTANSPKMKHMSTLGFKEGNLTQIRNKNHNENNESVEGYYLQYLNGPEGPSSSSGQKDALMLENGSGFSGGKENSHRSECGESLRDIFSDPITGILMEDAMILPCGHSYGSSGIQQIIRMKACYTCSQSVSEESVVPNLSLRIAVQAFKREEVLHANHMSKKRREKYDQHKGTFGDSTPSDNPKGKGVQFPFSVTDRVIIQGNKRTPLRFVGREAIVTTQCLNGWYVVKTLDNAESVKLQYRSLSRVTETLQPPKPLASKMTPPNWL